MEEDKKRLDIALFKYGLIAPVLQQQVSVQIEYFREVARKEHDVPHIGRRRFKVGTLKKWLKEYRHKGFEVLSPKQREDKGVSRKIDEAIGEVIREYVQRYAGLSSAALYRQMIAEGEVQPGQFNEGTLRRYIQDNQLMEEASPEPRKKFEHDHVNDLWIADTMHGPHIPYGRKTHKVFLIAAIDDHSRVIPGGRFFLQENTLCLEHILKEAIRRFGLPLVLYCDNGSLFASAHLQLACARLGIALVHSRPYDSPSRGKIERFFRCVRQKFLPLIDPGALEGIDHLNDLFLRWLTHDYHRQLHHGINETPMDRMMHSLRTTSVRRPTEEELDRAFQITLTRVVKNDSTVSIAGVLYECPARFIGKKIEVRYPSDKPHDLSIYEDHKPVAALKRLNLSENANPPHRGIRFTTEEQ
jgi:transposase InsO family protein